jgi:sulfur carrier protein
MADRKNGQDGTTSAVVRSEDTADPLTEIYVNGEPRAFASGTALADLLRTLGIDPDPESGSRGVAVAIDGRVVSRRVWATTPLAPGNRVEVIGAIGGG